MPHHGMVSSNILLSPVRVGCYGWGDPPIPEDLAALKQYVSELNVVGGPPEWLPTLVEMLVEGNSGMDVVSGKFRESKAFSSFL